MRLSSYSLSLFFALNTSCTFHFELTSPRTALENQIIGDYRTIDKALPEVQLAQAQRKISKGKGGEQGQTWAPLTPLQQRQFREEDIRYLKKLEFVGEGKKGFLVFLPPGIGRLSLASKGERFWAQSIIDQENHDRLSQVEALQNGVKDEKSKNLALLALREEILKKAQDGDWIEGASWEQFRRSELQNKEDEG